MVKPKCVFGGDPHWYSDDPCWHPDCPSYNADFAAALKPEPSLAEQICDDEGLGNRDTIEPLTQAERNARWRAKDPEKYRKYQRELMRKRREK